MARFKEPQYFAPHRTPDGVLWGQGNPYPEPGIDWYLRLFDDAHDVKYAGESSTSYTKRPIVEGCAERIRDFNLDARIVYLVRNPVHRTLSHYWYRVAYRREHRSLIDAVKEDIRYLSYSDYTHQIKPFLDCFGSERVHFVVLEELALHPDRVFRRLFDWLGVDSSFQVAARDRENVTPEEVFRPRFARSIVNDASRKCRNSRAARFVPGFAKSALMHLFYSRMSKDDVDVLNSVAFLQDRLRARVETFQELTGLQLSNLWSPLSPATSSNA